MSVYYTMVASLKWTSTSDADTATMRALQGIASARPQETGRVIRLNKRRKLRGLAE